MSFARRKHLPDDMNFLDEHDHRVAVFRKVLNARIRELLSEGLGTKVRQADPIFPEEGGKIWTRGIFGLDSSQALQYTVFLYNCKIFGLRAFNEHRNLEILIIVYFISSLDWLCEQLQI